MFKALLTRNRDVFSRKSTTPEFYPLLQQYSLPFSVKLLTTTSDQNSFVVSYLINNVGFSPESAVKVSKVVRFTTSEKADSVLTFFRNHGFSDSTICAIVRREPWLLSCDPSKRVLPKFEFLLSKGVSSSDIVRMVEGNPRFLKRSMKNCIIPTYKSLKRFLQSDERTVSSIVNYSTLLVSESLAVNIKLFVDNGVAYSNICRIFRVRPSVMCSFDLGKTVQEIKDLGFHPSKKYFSDAVLAKMAQSQSHWSEKIDTFKSWGWSNEAILEAFRRQPQCMLASSDKINAVMRFWVNELGWDSSLLVKTPGIFGYSLQKRIIPRATVFQHILSEGLKNKRVSFLSPFFMSEKLFLQKYVECFKEEETSLLLKLYQKKMNLEDDDRVNG